MEDVVAEDERDRTLADEVGADEERLGDALGAFLDRVGEVQTELATVTEQLSELRLVFGSRNDEHFSDAR